MEMSELLMSIDNGVKYKRNRITPEVILKSVAREINADIGVLISKSRKKHLVAGRVIVAVLCRELTHATVKEIGRLLGERDHSTVCHCSENFNSMLSLNDKHSVWTVETYNEVKKILKLKFPELN